MPRYTTDEIGQALRQARGMLYVAAKQLGCSPTTIRARLAASPALQAIHEAERGHVNDVAELKLFQAIEDGQPWAIQFRLRTRARDRGYGDRLDVGVSVRQQAERLAQVLASEGLEVTPEDLERTYTELKMLTSGSSGAI